MARSNGLRLEVAPGQEREDLWSVETHFKYAGYLERQQATIERARRLEHRRIPAGFSYAGPARTLA